MDADYVPVVRLTEKSLRRIKEKIEKLNAKSKQQNTDKTSPRKSEARVPRFEVYKPGVSRLSSRLLSTDHSTFSETTKVDVRNSPSRTQAYEGSVQRRSTKKDRVNVRSLTDSPEGARSWRKKPVDHQTKSRRNTGTARQKKYIKKVAESREKSPLAKSESEDSYDDEEEGFLARHERRRKRKGYHSISSNETSDHEAKKHQGSEDEFIWDDYHGDFLKDWPDENYSTSTISDDVTSSEKQERKNAKQVSKNAAAKALDIAIDTISLDDYEPDNGSSSRNVERGLLVKVSDNVVNEEANDSRKQLFNPDNPDIPIIVRPNMRDKKISKKKAAATDPNRPPPSQESRQSSNKRQPDSNTTSYEKPQTDGERGLVNPQTLSSKYTAHPNHWRGPVGIEYSDYAHDRPTEQDDVTAGILDRPSEQSYEKLLKDAENLESIINNLTSSRRFSLKTFNEKLQISRTELKQIYKTLILQHIEIATKHSVEQMLWKTVYYQLLEQLRNEIASSSGEEKMDLKNLLIVVLDQAMEFYENLLMRLQQMYKINLKDLFNNSSALKQFQKRIGKRTKLAIMSCHRSLICLGDISRYKENANDSSNFGRARQYYMQARSLEPRNGRPYNQLALLAVHTRRKLDAIYYYARSLATQGNPILTARESLIALFDDARRKYQKYKEDSQKEMKLIENQIDEQSSTKKRSVKSPRMIWISLDKGEEIVEKNIKETDDFQQKDGDTPKSSMTPNQLLRHFLLVFSHAHGKLFTRVGLDTFEKLKEELFDLFSTVLSEDSIIITKQTLLHVFAINFFTVHDQRQKQKNDSSGSSWLLTQSIELSFSMISILTRVVTSKLSEIPLNAGQILDPTFSTPLSILLPSLKISYDWLYSNRSIWSPDPPPLARNELHDVWASLALLCDWLISDFKKFPMRIYNQNHHNLEEVCLSEDIELAGFAPFINLDGESRFVPISEYTTTEQRHRAAECVRLDLIRDFLEYLCGMEQPILAFKQGRYVVLIEPTSVIEEAMPRLPSVDENSNDKAIVKTRLDRRRMHNLVCIFVYKNKEEISLTEDLSLAEDFRHGDEGFNELRALRDSLQRTKHDHDKRKDQIIASLEANPENSTLYVKPQNLIPDTNCFIDHLDYIKLLVKTGIYTVYVPLVVLTELQGLAQDSKGSDEHAMKVHAHSTTAVDFLQRKFSKSDRDLKLQALTNQGSILHTISFQSQSDTSSKATNDDLILQCCIKFEERCRPKSPAVKTVLLTDDRNLRVKALARNMPTKALAEFCKWAKIKI